MTVFPDGDALSDWELEILEDIEREIEVSDPRLAAFLFRGDTAPLYVLAAYVVAAEAAVALAALTASAAYTMAGLATIGTSLWATSIHAAQGLRPTPGLLGHRADD